MGQQSLPICLCPGLPSGSDYPWLYCHHHIVITPPPLPTLARSALPMDLRHPLLQIACTATASAHDQLSTGSSKDTSITPAQPQTLNPIYPAQP
jgi:hypothetical protein